MLKIIKIFLKLVWTHKGKIILALSLACGGWYLYKYKFTKTSQNIEITEQIRRGDITISINKDGAFQAKESFEVTSRADGKIKEIFVKEGDYVIEGQILLVVQPGQSVHDKYLPVEVIAPSSGLVLRCLNERRSKQSETTYDLPRVGESISGSNNSNSPTCIMKIIKPGKYVVPVKIGEYDITKIKIGMPLKINVPSRQGVSYDGFVSVISPQPEVKEERYWEDDAAKVEFITVAESKGNIKDILLGLSASVKIDLASKKDILLIPLNAIFEDRDTQSGDITFYVYKKTGANKREKIQAKLGLRNENDAELLNAEETGLKENDVLLIDVAEGDEG
jgi:HlyD family secretion protein